MDLLRATCRFLDANLPIQTNGQLFIAGYSQGGRATMALHRELEQHHATGFPLTASAPMAGPYDLSGTMTGPISQSVEYDGREYVPYLLFGFDGVYDLYDAPSDVLVAPYDGTLPPLFDDLHSDDEIDSAMPRAPRDIFKAAYVIDVTSNPANPLRVALQANDLHDGWTPQAKMRLYHCSGDEIVPYVNSQVAYSNFVDRGADVLLVDVGPYSHSAGVVPCFILAREWFNSSP